MTDSTTNPPVLPPDDAAISFSDGKNSVRLSRFAAVGFFLLCGAVVGLVILLAFNDTEAATALWLMMRG